MYWMRWALIPLEIASGRSKIRQPGGAALWRRSRLNAYNCMVVRSASEGPGMIRSNHCDSAMSTDQRKP